MNMFGIVWGTLKYSWVFGVALFAILLLVYRFKRVRAVVNVLAGSRIGLVLKNFSVTKQLLKPILLSVGLLFLCFALLHPQWQQTEQTVAQEGRDLFVALDISKSMLVTDCEPNRLVCAKNKVKELLAQLSCERVGLILFSGSALVQCPLTADHSAFKMFLDAVDVESISSGTTALEAAINQALQAFERMPSKKNKLLVIFTDGEDFSSNLAACKKRAQQEGMHVFAMGVGTLQGAPIPLFDAKGNQVGHQKDTDGSVVVSRLNETLLHTLARDIGGVYLRATSDMGDVTTLVRQVQSYEKEKFEDRTVAQADQQYPYFLAVSFACLALEWLL